MKSFANSYRCVIAIFSLIIIFSSSAFSQSDLLIVGKDNAQVREVGIEWCIQQSKELKDNGIPVLHYYSMGKSDNIKAIAARVF